MKLSLFFSLNFSCAAASVVTRPLGLEQIRRTKTAVVDGLFFGVWFNVLLESVMYTAVYKGLFSIV